MPASLSRKAAALKLVDKDYLTVCWTMWVKGRISFSLIIEMLGRTSYDVWVRDNPWRQILLQTEQTQEQTVIQSVL